MFQMKKEAFSVLGKEGSTQQGPGFIQALWEDANGHFAQIAHLAKRDGQGNLLGVWGALAALAEEGLPLAGAVQELTLPAAGKEYLCFPVRKLL